MTPFQIDSDEPFPWLNLSKSASEAAPTASRPERPRASKNGAAAVIMCPRFDLREPIGTSEQPSKTAAELWSDLGRILGASQPPETWPALIARLLETRRAANGLAADQAGFIRAASLLSGLGDALRGRVTGEGGGPSSGGLGRCGHGSESISSRRYGLLPTRSLDPYEGGSREPHRHPRRP